MKKNLWEDFAINDAEYYILTDNPYPSNSKEGMEYFFKSGEEFTNKMLAGIKESIDFNGTVCEIGCGVGRLLIPHSKLFAKSVGVDISETMLNKLMANSKKLNVDNITPYLSFEPWYNNNFSYVYSFIVFQHISDFETIKDYVLKIGKSLQKNGIANLHFDTRKKTIIYLLRNALPDFILPKSQRKGIRRIRRNSSELEMIFKEANLEIVSETRKDSKDHIFVLRK
ncbi:MAG TPA: methyltransferase domain-containing protein [Mucilaginibacter sp.]|jgi:cyclopropane fatty-acyl-phospholipid synthase-like methyltransferase